MSWRYAGMSSRRAGLPYAIRTTAVLIGAFLLAPFRRFARATRELHGDRLEVEGGPRRPRGSTASRGHLDRSPLVHEFDEPPERRGIRIRQDAVPEIEDVPRPPVDPLEDPHRSRLRALERSQE